MQAVFECDLLVIASNLPTLTSLEPFFHCDKTHERSTDTLRVTWFGISTSRDKLAQNRTKQIKTLKTIPAVYDEG
jgi:hypothetical protein